MLNLRQRKVFGVLSLVVLALVVGAKFHQDYGKADDYPLILNPKFKYFTRDPMTGDYKPFLWEAAYTGGPKDLTFLRHDTVEGRECLGLHVYQDGANDSYSWATIHVKQTLRGEAVTRLFSSRIGVSIYPTFRFAQDPVSREPWNVFGLEINDGKHLMWFVFSDQAGSVYSLRNHRIVLVSARLNQWSYTRIDIAGHYSEAGWEKPDDLSLILIAGATKMDSGNRAGYYGEIRLEPKTE